MASSSAPKAVSRRLSLGSLPFMTLLHAAEGQDGSTSASPERQHGRGDAEASDAHGDDDDGGHRRISVEIGGRKYR